MNVLIMSAQLFFSLMVHIRNTLAIWTTLSCTNSNRFQNLKKNVNITSSIKGEMKALIQRVTSAKVTVGDDLISSIGRGFCVLVGICQDDTVKDVDYIARKLLSIRLFDDSNGKRWQRNVKEEDLELLCVSQFTLYNRLKGNKPDFHLAMQGPDASNLYNTLLMKLGEQHSPEKIKDGVFGAMMQVHIQNDGPVTIEIESPRSAKTVEDATVS